MKYRLPIIASGFVILLSAGCVPAEQGSPSEASGAVELGQPCGSSLDCDGALKCLARAGQSVCVQPCRSTAECGPDSACSPLPGVNEGFCSLPEASPDPIGEPEAAPEPEARPEPIPEPEPQDDPRATYPAGPFGTRVGDVVADHRLSRPDGSPLTLGQIRADADREVLLIFATASWCSRCAGDLPDLIALDRQYGADGLVVMVSVFEDRNFEPAVPAEAGFYKSRHGLPFEVVADTPGVLHQYFSQVALPMVMAVELDTMQLLSAELGWDPNAIERLIQSKL